MNLVKNHNKIFRSKCFYVLPTINNNSYHFIRKRYFYSTTILNNLSTKQLSSDISIPTIENKDYCPGCGAKFQNEDSSKPGYLINLSSFITCSSTNKKNNEKSNDKKMSKEEIEDAINNLPEDIKKLMYPFKYSSTFTRKETKIDDSNLKEREKERIFCQRCYNLKYHNKIKSSSSSSSSSSWQENLTMDKSFLNFLQKKKNSIILTIIDIIDFPGSLIKNLDNLIGKNNPNILIANKIDLLPKNFDEDMIKIWLKNSCSEYGIKNIHKIFLCSAKKNWMIKDLCNEISKIKYYNDNIYLIGNTNVGKSELINSFLRTYVHNSKKYEVTSSHIPGTTINMLGLPLNIFGDTFGKSIKGMLFNNNNNNQEDHRFLFDTPGIVNENQLFHFLDQEELKMIIPQKSIRPLTYVFKPGKSLLFGGLGRIDYKMGEKPIRITVFSGLDSHITSIEKADKFYKQLSSNEQNHFLKPPIGSIERLKKFPEIIKSIKDLKVVSNEELYIKTKKVSILDIVWSGVGWCSIGGVKIGETAIFDVWSPDGKGVYVRNVPLLPYEFHGKIEKIK
ncbi:hypothetical protein RclHR1_03960016 [Rhizophagus clarus]|uniref:Ribosome biogenesis GTPase YqeH n=1 Tax=Rhizophagus clarus TaxID=94130 RepID=A0A2Z6RW58_9GLOM|nr:hypothetical protein RclHR1_03960016 [Rhizophagus clarus]GES79641.1 ribosome biogenesis GTPase YqeH [Rhizophagus clarus]